MDRLTCMIMITMKMILKKQKIYIHIITYTFIDKYEYVAVATSNFAACRDLGNPVFLRNETTLLFWGQHSFSTLSVPIPRTRTRTMSDLRSKDINYPS